MKNALCWLMILSLFCCSPGLAEDTEWPENIRQIAAEYEPGPYGGESLQEMIPFSPLPLSPEDWMREMQAAQSAEAVIAYIGQTGLPLDPLDSEYFYHYRASVRREDVSLPKGSTLTVVTYAYSEAENDNFALLFLQQDGEYALVDCIPNFGKIHVLSCGDHIYLMGKTGSDYQTTRWYHLQSRKMVLSYLSQGVNPDRQDYHIAVNCAEFPGFQVRFSQEGRLQLLRQLSVWDYTRSPLSDDAREIILSTRLFTYAVQEDGTLLLEDAEIFERQTLEQVLKEKAGAD